MMKTLLLTFAALAARAQAGGEFVSLFAATEARGDCRAVAACAARSAGEQERFEAVVRGEGSAVDRRWARVTGASVRWSRRGELLGVDAGTETAVWTWSGVSFELSGAGEPDAGRRFTQRLCAGEAECLASGAATVERFLIRDGGRVSPAFVGSYVSSLPALARPALLSEASRRWTAALDGAAPRETPAETAQRLYLQCYGRCSETHADARGCADACP